MKPFEDMTLEERVEWANQLYEQREKFMDMDLKVCLSLTKYTHLQDLITELYELAFVHGVNTIRDLHSQISQLKSENERLKQSFRDILDTCYRDITTGEGHSACLAIARKIVGDNS